jgi:hypothetical protein
MVIGFVAVFLFLVLVFLKLAYLELPPQDFEDENLIRDHEMAKEIVQALRETQIIRKYETVNEETLQPYARRLWQTECPVEQIQIGLEVADVVTQHAEIVEIDPVLHRRSQFTLIVNKKLLNNS